MNIVHYSLLDVLADRKDRDWVSGHVLINGEKQPHNFKCASGYVVQVCGLCVHICMHVCMHVCMYVCVYVCVYMYVFMYVCVYMYVCVFHIIGNFQDDILTGTLTIRENVHLSASLRLPSEMDRQEKEEKVNEVIKELGLSHVANTLVTT